MSGILETVMIHPTSAFSAAAARTIATAMRITTPNGWPSMKRAAVTLERTSMPPTPRSSPPAITTTASAIPRRIQAVPPVRIVATWKLPKRGIRVVYQATRTTRSIQMPTVQPWRWTHLRTRADRGTTWGAEVFAVITPPSRVRGPQSAAPLRSRWRRAARERWIRRTSRGPGHRRVGSRAARSST